MRICLPIRMSNALNFIRLGSAVSVALGVTIIQGSEQGANAVAPRQKSSITSLLPALNELMIGCSQDSAINYLLQKSGCRLELVSDVLAGARTDLPEEYDEAYVLRLGSRSDDSWSSDIVCLYFRDGYLAYKCVAPNENVDSREVFRCEIKSGLQHPPNDPDLMDNIKWGRTTEPGIEELAADTFERVAQPAVSLVSNERQELPNVRCGIALKGLPTSATEQGYNLLVVYQNMGPTDLTDEMLLGYPANPGIMVTAKYADHGQSTGYPGNFGIYGPKAYHWRDGEEEKDVRRAAFRLRPGEATYMWFQVPNLESCLALQARTIWLRGATKQGDRLIVRDWDADSPVITTAKPVRTCSGITE